MKKTLWKIVIPVLVVLGLAGFGTSTLLQKNNNQQPTHLQVKAQFEQDIVALDTAVGVLRHHVLQKANEAQLQADFKTARLAWKRIEWLAELYFPEASKNTNGPALDEFEDESGYVVPPHGFQVVEEYLFPYDPAQHADLTTEIEVLKSTMNRLKLVARSTDFTDSHVFDALRLEVFRLITLGITGFDSPVSFQSLPEGRASVAAIGRYLQIYEAKLLEKQPNLARELRQLLTKTEQRLTGNFETFDRLAFITDCANPLSGLLLDAQKALQIPVFDELRALRPDARTLFDEGAFEVAAFGMSSVSKPTAAKVALGKQLFYDPVLSGNGQRSCASCHQPDKGFADGLPKALALDGKSTIGRNTPTILNAALSRVLFADSRVVYLEDQATDVVTNASEMHGSFEVAVEKIKAIKKYTQQFAANYPDGVTSFNVRNAIANYERSLVRLNSRFDEYVRGDKTALNEAEKRGFNLFAGKAKCATCHFVPLTNGTVPPAFDKSESEVMGVFTAPLSRKIDPDLGKFNLTKAEIHRFSFKTPTVRNAALTAPYMHNGAYKTLEEVVDFYDHGGAAGLGLDLPNQTLPPDKLNLTKQEKADIIAFMKALTDLEQKPL